MKIYTSNYHIVEITPGSSIAHMTVLSATERLTREGFQQDLLSMCESMEAHVIEGLLGDNRKQRFTIDIETQQWLGQVIYSKFIQMGIRKMAMLMPHEFMAQLSLEQTFEEVRGKQGEVLMQMAFFEDESEARVWLRSLESSPQEV